MQNYGLLRQAHRRSGRRLEGRRAWLDLGACLLAPLRGVLLYRAPSRVRTTARPSRRPSAGSAAVLAAGARALVLWLAREVRAARRGEPVGTLGIVLVRAHERSVVLAPRRVRAPSRADARSRQGTTCSTSFVWRFEARPEALTVLPVALRGRFAPPRRIAYLVALGALGASVTIVLTLVAIRVRAAAARADRPRPRSTFPRGPRP